MDRGAPCRPDSDPPGQGAMWINAATAYPSAVKTYPQQDSVLGYLAAGPTPKLTASPRSPVDETETAPRVRTGS